MILPRPIEIRESLATHTGHSTPFGIRGLCGAVNVTT
jgi:hypothetical protein